MTPGTFVGLAALVGALIGSFLNVCIYRIPIGRSVVWPASACESCARELAWYENLPIVSWLVLGGRCRTCRAPLSVRHPLIEALTAVMFGAAAWYYGPSVLLVSRLVFGCILIVLFVIDFDHQLLPNVITLPGIIVGFVFSFLTPEPGWFASLLGVIAGGGSLWLIAEGYYRIRHEEGLGMGDVKMLAMIGAFIGWQLTLVTLMMASFAGALIGVGLIASGKGMKYAIPFGTFLALGAAAAATVGPGVLRWYLGFWAPM